MARVEVRDGELIEDALRRFKRQCEREGILREVKKHEYYITPSTKRKLRLNEAIRKQRRKDFKVQRRQPGH